MTASTRRFILQIDQEISVILGGSIGVCSRQSTVELPRCKSPDILNEHQTGFSLIKVLIGSVAFTK